MVEALGADLIERVRPRALAREQTLPVAAQLADLLPGGSLRRGTTLSVQGDAATSLEGAFPEATVMTVLNGLGAEEIVREHGSWPIVSGVTFMSGTKHSDTHVEYILDTETWLGPYENTPFERAQEIADRIVEAGLRAEALPDLRPAQWSKLIFNAAVNPVAALTGLPHDPHFAAEAEPGDLGHLVHGLVDEGKAVAAAA